MFFIFGSPRSGTTLLSSILNLHADIVIPDETDFIVPVAFICDRVKQPEIGRRLITELIYSTERYAISIGEFLSPSDIERIVQSAPYDGKGIIWSLYDGVAKSASKRFAGDKRPSDIKDIPILRKTGVLDEECKIIHIVRDPRDVYLSCEKQGWKTGPQFMHNWSCANLRLNKAFREHREQYLLLKYEDFVLAPEQTIRSVTNHLSVPWQADLMDDSRRGLRYAGHSAHIHLNNPITNKHVGLWKKCDTSFGSVFSGYDNAFKWFGYDSEGCEN
jgi:hypothetical protein